MTERASRWSRLLSSPAALPIAFLLGVLALRLPVLLSHLDSWYPFEIHAGTVATAILDGLDLQLARLPVVAHIRGGVLLGLVLVPAYAAFGVSALVMKATVLLWHGVTVALLVYLLARFFTRRVAVVFGALMLFAPPVTTKLSVLALASHMESPLIASLALLPFLAMTVEREFARGRWLGFGVAVGFAGFFHLQALLPCLLLLGLLVLLETRLFFTRGVFWVLLGIAVGSAPSFLFDDGNVALLQSQFAAPELPVASDDVTGLAKVSDLAGGDFAASLEFGEAGPEAGAVLATSYSALLLIGCLLALWQQRDGLVGLARRTLFRRDSSYSPAAFFILHALLVVVLFGASKMESTAEVGSGLEGRRLAPMMFSLTALAAIGIGAPGRGWLRTWLLLAPLCVLGAIGLQATASTGEASRLAHRGECYEWFGRQLGRDRPGHSLVALIARVDRGDPRFRPLRFPFPFAGSTPAQEAFLAGTGPDWSRLSPEVATYRLVQLGRQLGARRATLPDVLGSESVAALTELQREALLHGVGMALDPPRPSEGPQVTGRFLARLNQLLTRMPQPFVDAVVEGYGFRMGMVFDPYSVNLNRQVAAQTSLAERVQPAFYLGLGWGLAQRYLTPPGRLPPDLNMLSHIPRKHRLRFRAGFLGLELPREAAVFAGD